MDRHSGKLLAGIHKGFLLSDFKVRILRSNRPKASGVAGYRLKACRYDEGQPGHLFLRRCTQ